MRQVLFEIPILGGVNIFGYGLMLFFAFLGSMNLAAWRARREKLDPEVIYDLALWVFVGGLLGARLFYVVQYWGVRIHSVASHFSPRATGRPAWIESGSGCPFASRLSNTTARPALGSMTTSRAGNAVAPPSSGVSHAAPAKP